MTVLLSAANPYYTRRAPDWKIMRDAWGGERYVKEAGTDYLAPSSMMLRKGMGAGGKGLALYTAYVGRALYHEIVKPSAMAMLGVMHRKAPIIKLPARLEPLRTRATFNGESLEVLLQRINEEQMVAGRYGLMLDVREGATVNELPYIVTYKAETMLNWDSTKQGDDQGRRQLEFVSLNESGQERTAGSLAWGDVQRYRIVTQVALARELCGGEALNADWNATDYVTAAVKGKATAYASDFKRPEFGGRTLSEIPFVFIGPRDLVPEPDLPLLMPLARMALAIYRLEADYRQSLYMQGQATLVTKGDVNPESVDEGTEVGAFAEIQVPVGGDAKYISADPGGLDKQEAAIQNDFSRVAQLGGQLLSERGNEAEAAAALNVRVASRVATLTTGAVTSCEGMERILKLAATWVGADPNEVSVKPNLDFVDDPAQAQDLTYVMTAKKLGLPWSEESIHAWLKRKEWTALTYDEEKKRLDAEPPDINLGTPGVAGIGGNGLKGNSNGTRRPAPK